MQKLNTYILNLILVEIKENPCITQEKLAKKYFYSERNMRRYFKILKDNGKIELIRNGKSRHWIIK